MKNIGNSHSMPSKSWRERGREMERERRNYCFSISDRGERHRDFKEADGWTLVALNMEQRGTGKRYGRHDIVNENWQKRRRYFSPSRSLFEKPPSLLLFALRRTTEGLRCLRHSDKDTLRGESDQWASTRFVGQWQRVCTSAMLTRALHNA